MQFHARVRLVLSCSAVVALIGCSGSSNSDVGSTLPGNSSMAHGALAAGLSASRAMRPGMHHNFTGCSPGGPGSFVGGGGGSNVAGGGDSGVLSGSTNAACDAYSAVGAGQNNGIGSSGSFSGEFIGAGASNSINGGDNTFIGAGQNNTINSGEYTFLGAGYGNTVNVGADYSFLGGGNGNTISGAVSTLTGGEANNVSGAASFIGGGIANNLPGQYSVLVGGTNNTVSGQRAFVGSGQNNAASGGSSVVPGGLHNTASGYVSFAAGYYADANKSGSFVWSDESSTALTKPSAAQQFVARASGGVVFFSNAAMTTGVQLPAGSGTWASLSDRNVKTNVVDIDDAAILDKVAGMPISEWSYISEHGVRHVGPMAQDFYAAFGMGEDNKHITSIDEDGVALAAIKALNHRLAAKNAALTMRLSQDEKRLARLEALVGR